MMTTRRRVTALSIMGLGLLTPHFAFAQELAIVSPPPAPSAKAFEGTHGFVGLTAAGGVAWAQLDFGHNLLFNGWSSAAAGQMLFAVKGGVLLGRAELGVEVAPFTYIPLFEERLSPQFEAHGYGGYHVRLSDKVSWPLRAGLGIVTGNSSGAVLLHSRLDLVGISIPYGSWLIDLHLPSFRVTNTLGQPTITKQVYLTWLFGASVSLLP